MSPVVIRVHVLRVIFAYRREGTEPILGRVFDFEAHLCDERAPFSALLLVTGGRKFSETSGGSSGI